MKASLAPGGFSPSLSKSLSYILVSQFVGNGDPLAGSIWCEEHQQVQTLLDLGAKFGYPRTQLTRHRAIGAGRGNWEAYACRAPMKWLCHDLLLIPSIFSMTRVKYLPREDVTGCINLTNGTRPEPRRFNGSGEEGFSGA
jgi:hypothetical protein